ncbi:hypothetical protein [Pseudoflavitalea rhizosphaerae]|uniref:hypothetical protein n=1 Tax=Pseudoflavitalea rhizosphaerae TaxID=1884793 RepID=UPI000F8E3171|nr:hypothetical protein [Pseudoflavitalea rhizosphaerae]
MNGLISTFALMLLMASCTRFQYLTISSSSAGIQKNAGGQFVAENDSVVTIYDLKGEGIILGMKIINKHDKALTVNWKKSSVVINDEAVSLVPDAAVTAGAARSETLKLNSEIATGGTNFTAVTSLPVEKQQIPPRSFVTRELLKVTGGWYKIPLEDYTKKTVVLEDNSKVRVRELSFNEDESLLRFRTYLTLEPEDGGEPVILQHAFYVAGITRTGNIKAGADRPYLEKLTNVTSVVAGVIVGSVLIVAGMSAWNAADEKDKNN